MTVQKYRNIIKFTTRAHQLYLQPRRDPQHQWLTTTSFQLSKEEIDAIIQDWPAGWKHPVVDDLLSIEIDPQQEGT